MKKTIFKGAAVALITPMNNDGSVNYDELKKLINFQLENKTDAIVSCGTTGESATLSEVEKAKVIEFTINQVNNKVPVIAGTGCNCTEKVLQASKEAQSLGADALLVVTPYYNKTSQNGLIKHYNYIADNVDTPIILYNVPSRTGVNILPETYKELSKHKNIVATKEANADISSIAKTISLCGEDLNIYSGNDDQTLPILSLGGIGVISVLSNLCPARMVELVDAGLKGDFAKCREYHYGLAPMFKAEFCDGNPTSIKYAMNYKGLPAGTVRLPLVEVTDSAKKTIESAISECKI